MIACMAGPVLIVDDDPPFLSLAARILGDLGIGEVVTAADAAAAMRTANATRPAAALVDVGLPDRDGIDLAHELSELPWSPRVVLTSTDRDAVSAIGSDGRSPLPFVPKDELATAPLRRMLVSE
jgi:DNA-binding response OmpR family regulator